MPLHREAALVQQPVVAPAQLDQVAKRRLAAVRPVADVVGADEAGVSAVRKLATSVAGPLGESFSSQFPIEIEFPIDVGCLRFANCGLHEHTFVNNTSTCGRKLVVRWVWRSHGGSAEPPRRAGYGATDRSGPLSPQLQDQLAALAL